MSPLPPKIASKLRLLCHPSHWKWLERFINRASFVPIRDCGEVTEFKNPECWTDPQTGMPRSKMTKTGAFARYFFPDEARRIEMLRKSTLATKKVLATVEKLASEVKAQGELDTQEEKAKTDEAETMAKADPKESSEGDNAAGDDASAKEPDAAGKAVEEGTEAAKKKDEGDTASASVEATKTTR